MKRQQEEMRTMYQILKNSAVPRQQKSSVRILAHMVSGPRSVEVRNGGKYLKVKRGLRPNQGLTVVGIHRVDR
jgi:hypothetical protein